MLLQPAAQSLAQGLTGDRFGEVIGHAGGGAERFVLTRAVTSDCTGLPMTYLKFGTLPIPAIGPYYGRLIAIPGRDEIEGIALKSPNCFLSAREPGKMNWAEGGRSSRAAALMNGLWGGP
jgi:hypothetical protein